MNSVELLAQIADQDYPRQKFVQEALQDQELRSFLVEQLRHPDIMVYFHCYEILLEATSQQPKLFYQDWEFFRELLQHPNSYHRDMGLAFLANLISVDTKEKFPKCIDEYCALIKDVKMKTASHCLAGCQQILAATSNYLVTITDYCWQLVYESPFNEKQTAYLMGYIVELMAESYQYYAVAEKEKVCDFIQLQLTSSSPKTQKKAKAALVLIE